ncbi:DUF309 domain-containing protein [Oxyplasma meridianum]|uniref:DUF309 domain-containing protein n=1 Tax=Oxyplasma meridianum TaxID=3073602 RepID=A0AAX4NEI4_9ARCH
MRLIFHILYQGGEINIPKEIKNKFRKIIIRRNTSGFELDIHTDKLAESIESVKSLYDLQMISFPDSIERSFEIHGILNKDKIVELLKFSESLTLQERYWESHIILENLWKSSEGIRRSYFQGLILISASMVQYQMGNFSKSLEIYGRSCQLIRSSGINRDLLSKFPKNFSYPISLNYESMLPDE